MLQALVYISDPPRRKQTESKPPKERQACCKHHMIYEMIFYDSRNNAEDN